MANSLINENATFWHKAKVLLPVPNSGVLWRDIAYLTIILWLQTTIMIRISPLLTAELVTAWLCTCFVFQPPWRCLILGLIAALTLETSYSAPAFLYVVSYWILGTFALAVRNHISWRKSLPWASFFLFAEIWVTLAEFFVGSVKTQGFYEFQWVHLASLSMRIGIILGLGMFLAARGAILNPEEAS